MVQPNEPSQTGSAPDHPEWRELAEYLGADFHPEYCVDPVGRLADEFRRFPDEEAFYAGSRAYLYDLAAFSVSGLKEPLRGLVRALAPDRVRLLDYGCGSGSDGLALLDSGYRVAFADFENPSTRYLRWRIARRGLTAPVYSVGEGGVPPQGLAYAFDVLEHVDDPVAALRRLAGLARVVVVNLVTTPEAERERFPMHRNHDWDAVTRWITSEHRLICSFRLAPDSWYQVVAFRPAGVRPLSRVREAWVRGAARRLPPLRRSRFFTEVARRGLTGGLWREFRHGAA